MNALTGAGRAATTKRISRTGKWFLICPVRHGVFFLCLITLGMYFALRGDKYLMTQLCSTFVLPYHKTAARASSVFPFSLAELIYGAAVILMIVCLAWSIYRIIKSGGKLRGVYKTALSLILTGLVFYSGSCLLWSSLYYAEGFADKSGIETRAISAEELSRVTALFADKANHYGAMMGRDEEGLYAEEPYGLFEGSGGLYKNAVEKFPFLDAPDSRPKPMIFSYIMSYIKFTGFFFPLTGEANLNTHSPHCMLPATIAHEMAHQRGVAREDEANFVAVLACLESENPTFCYSASLLAYIHLASNLHGADYNQWEKIYNSLNEEVRKDLRHNNAYWSSFDTGASKAAASIYSGYLRKNGQELGMKSYGACVDLLVAYYLDQTTGK